MTPEKVLRHPPIWVRDYVGLPFKARGRTRDGLDCWGLFRLIQMEVFGRALPAYDDVDWPKMSNADIAHLMDGERAHQGPWREIGHYDEYARKWHQAEPERPGDGLLCRMDGQAMHVAVVVCQRMALHIEQGIDAVTFRWDRPDWQHRLVALYRWDPP